MSESFKGVVNVDVRDSEPDWAPFEPPKAPEGAPNLLYVVLDDVGFSAMSCYGGPVETPNISIYHGATKVGEAETKTQMGFFAVAGAGLYVGRHAGDPLTDDYPGKPPYRFTGGKLHRVVIDVSGQPYTDLEHHAAMLLKHQ